MLQGGSSTDSTGGLVLIRSGASTSSTSGSVSLASATAATRGRFRPVQCVDGVGHRCFRGYPNHLWWGINDGQLWKYCDSVWQCHSRPFRRSFPDYGKLRSRRRGVNLSHCGVLKEFAGRQSLFDGWKWLRIWGHPHSVRFW